MIYFEENRYEIKKVFVLLGSGDFGNFFVPTSRLTPRDLQLLRLLMD